MKRIKGIFFAVSLFLAVSCVLSSVTVCASAGAEIKCSITYKSDCTVLKIKASDASCSIYYTLDGSEPTTDSAAYKRPLAFKKGATIMIAQFTEKGKRVGKLIQREIKRRCPAPRLSVTDNFDGTAKVVVLNKYDDTVTHYTTDGSEPTEDSPILDGYFLAKGSNTVIKAVSVIDGWDMSSVSTVRIGDYVTSVSYDDYILTALEKTNEAREENGLPPLKLNEKLCAAAKVRAAELSLNYDNGHVRPNGTKWATAITAEGYVYRFAAENYAMTSGKGVRPELVIQMLMGSEVHRSNILNTLGSEVGVACVQSGDRCYWVQLFGEIK